MRARRGTREPALRGVFCVAGGRVTWPLPTAAAGEASGEMARKTWRRKLAQYLTAMPVERVADS